MHDHSASRVVVPRALLQFKEDGKNNNNNNNIAKTTSGDDFLPIVFPKGVDNAASSTDLPPLPNLAELADTARIKITKEEISDWEPKINAIVGWFGQLNDIDIEKEWERLGKLQTESRGAGERDALAIEIDHRRRGHRVRSRGVIK